MRIAKCRYVNCFHRLSSLAEVSTKLQKMYFFQQFNPNKPGLFLSPCKSGGGGVIFVRGKQILITLLLFIVRTRKFSTIILDIGCKPKEKQFAMTSKESW